MRFPGGTAAALGLWVATVVLGLAFLAVKGSPRHRAWGKGFFALLMVVALTVGPVLMLRPGPFDPAFVVGLIGPLLVIATGYFDRIATTVDPTSSTTALVGSTEEGQFH